MKICAIIPTHNHSAVLANVIAELHNNGLDVFVIDDGSKEPHKSAIAALQNVNLFRFETNQGKGVAVLKGFELAYLAGYSHAIQVDADGQHDLSVIPQMLKLARENPTTLISGQPIYDDSIPKSRKIGRWLTHVWVWVETLSFRIKDSMCGFRVYPLKEVIELMESEPIGKRMDFDTDIMVRLFWRGTDVIMLPVEVTYPPENTSNFDVLHDNIRITKMHTRLVFTMLARLPSILKHRPRKAAHWARIGEVGAYWGLKTLAITYKLIGRIGCQTLMAPVVFYFYVKNKKQRDASRLFLSRTLGRKATFWEGYKHFLSFAVQVMNGFIVWTGNIPRDRLEAINEQIIIDLNDSNQGAIIIISHIGNAEIARALYNKNVRQRLLMMRHTKNSENFNRLMREFHPEAGLNTIQVTEIGPETIINVKDRVENGAWVAIAGDRVPVTGSQHNLRLPFLGSDAPFAQGPWIMASLLECPVYTLFCLQVDEHYELQMEKMADKITLPRGNREEALREYMSRYVSRLEEYAKNYPFQWFNFYDFWEE